MPRLLACLFLPDPVAAAIRRVQTDVADYRPLLPPHLTLAPPVDDGFPVGALRAACREVGPLDLVVGPPGSFPSAERVAFLQVTGPGLPGLARLNRALGGTGDLVPHVTIVRGLSRELFDATMAAAAGMRWAVRVDEVHVVSMTHDGARWRWEPYETLTLESHAALP